MFICTYYLCLQVLLCSLYVDVHQYGLVQDVLTSQTKPVCVIISAQQTIAIKPTDSGVV